MPWAYLLVSGVLEVVWSGAMKASDGFSKPGWSALVFVSATAGFWLLSLAMRDLPLGTAYTIWVGIGAVGAFVVGVIWMGEPLSVHRCASVGLIVAGIVGLRLAEGTT